MMTVLGSGRCLQFEVTDAFNTGKSNCFFNVLHIMRANFGTRRRTVKTAAFDWLLKQALSENLLQCKIKIDYRIAVRKHGFHCKSAASSREFKLIFEN